MKFLGFRPCVDQPASSLWLEQGMLSSYSRGLVKSVCTGFSRLVMVDHDSLPCVDWLASGVARAGPTISGGFLLPLECDSERLIRKRLCGPGRLVPRGCCSLYPGVVDPGGEACNFNSSGSCKYNSVRVWSGFFFQSFTHTSSPG